MKREQVFLESFGGVWTLTPRNFKRLCHDAAAGREWNLDDYGKRVADDLKHVTDSTPEEFAGELDSELDCTCSECIKRRNKSLRDF